MRWTFLFLLPLACTTPTQLPPTTTPAAPWPTPLLTPTQTPADLTDLTLLDTRKKSDFNAGHLPGARRADWTLTREGLLIGGKLAPTHDIARAFAKLGVHDGKRVLVCGEGKTGWGEEGRVAWTLRVLGHPAVALLDAPCESLKDRGWTKDKPPRLTGTFTARLNPKLRATKDQVRTTKAQLLDVRSLEEFNGATPWLEARGGRIPGAKHLEFTRLVDDDSGALPRAELEAALTQAGLDPSKPIIAYCTGGVRSALATEVLRARGFEVRNYDGSFWEWAADKSLPVELPETKTP